MKVFFITLAVLGIFSLTAREAEAPQPVHAEKQAPLQVEKPKAVRPKQKTWSQLTLHQKIKKNPRKCNLRTHYIMDGTKTKPDGWCKKKPRQTQVAAEPVAQSYVQVASGGNNEAVAWNFFMGQGFTANQTAGIMGNLQQEHGFNTSHAAGGLGIAQWLGGRANNLMAKPNYLNIEVQLRHVMEEFRTSEGAAYNAIKAATTVEGATMAFQNLYERCGDCRQEVRVAYAYAILKRYN